MRHVPAKRRSVPAMPTSTYVASVHTNEGLEKAEAKRLPHAAKEPSA